MPTMAEALFLLQPWVQTRSAMDYCKLCFQERNGKEHIRCKLAHLNAYNSVMATLQLEKSKEFEDAYKEMEEAKQACLTAEKPTEVCHGKSQETLKKTLKLYDHVIEEYKKRLPSRQPKTIG